MRLSICIPTFDRAGPLHQLLESIARQDNYVMDVEVVISDNASTDDTADVVHAFIENGMNINYRKLPENRGFDRNIINVVDLAGGEYCWLFGSDDIMEEGALARVERVLTGACLPTGVSVGCNGYSKDLSRRVAIHDHISRDYAGETVLHGRDAIVDGIGPWGLGYISSVIVRRRAWIDAVASSPVAEYFNGYVHIYVLARTLDARSVWICVPDQLVGNRTDNDQAGSATDEFKRTRLDLDGFDASLGGALGRRSRAYHGAMRKVATFYIRSHFLSAKATGASSGYWMKAIPRSVSLYWRYPSFWIKTMPIALLPQPVLRLLKTAYKRTLSSRD